jgi:crotonobetainyl-CoA:carnitine CoA-transferase CaiB-like acyl-CoA transferase
MAETPAMATLESLWTSLGLDPQALELAVLTGADPVLPSSFAIGTAAQASIAAAALAAAELHAHRPGGARQQVRVAMRDAAAAEFRSERALRVNGGPAPDPWDKIAGLYRCGDGWVRLHTNFPHHRDGVLRLLGCGHERDSVAAALARRKALEFEAEATAAGLVVAALRDTASWDASPQGKALAAEPLIAIDRIGDAPPLALPPAARPLAGIRVLELTRIIAGPVAGRILAAHGAEVLHVTGPDLPQVMPLVIDTGRGKRSAFLELREAAGREALQHLAVGADVFLQSYRPGALEALGFGAEALAALRPGIVHASLSAYGFSGPWAGRRGFDSLVQTATGLNLEEAQDAGSVEPRTLPAQALDHAGGTLLAFGILAALLRRAEQGGSWRVRVSLARTALWLRSLPRIPGGTSAPDPGQAAFDVRAEEVESPFGRLAAIRHAAELAATPAHWALPPVPPGTHPPAWT